MSAPLQLRLIILGVVVGALVGFVAVLPREAFSVALVIFIGVGLLAAALRLAPHIHSLHPAVGRIAITLAGVTVVGLALNVLAQGEARLTPGHPVERESMMAPAPAGAPQIAGQTTPPATPATPGGATSATSPPPQLPPPPPPSGAAVPAQTPAAAPSAAPTAPPTAAPTPAAAPAPTAVPASTPAPTSIIPSLPPLPLPTLPGLP